MTEPARVYAPDGDIFALVDPEDYQWAVQWRWSLKWSRGGTKVYMRRVVQTTLQPGTAATRFRVQRTIWLHRAIVIERMGLVPPTPEHVMVDHEDGDEMNCQRRNLRWATPSMNRINCRPTSATIRRRLGL